MIHLGTGALRIEIWPLGARLNGVSFDGIGPLVDGASTRDEALTTKKFNGAVAGPVANRIGGGRAEIDGQVHFFERNEGDMTTLHSGADGVHAHDWTVDTQNDDRIRLTLHLADGLGGFPGNRNLIAEYAVSNDTMTVSFSATTDAPTLINLALHPYWCNGTRGRDGLELKVNADQYLPVSNHKIPFGHPLSVDDTTFDLRDAKVPPTNIDHNYCLPGGNAARLLSDKVAMDIETDAPGLQVFTGKAIGIALEPQHWPDAPHHTNFPSILLRPGETYRQTSHYRFALR